MRVSFYTLGCKVNQNETGALAQLFRQNGYTLAGPDEEADVFVVNSCTVTAGGDKKSRQWLRRAKRQYPGAVTVLTGCYPQAFPEEAAAVMEADVVMGNANRHAILNNVARALEGERVVDIAAHEKGEAFEELVAKASRLVEKLGLHHRISKLAAGDCSASMARTYDIEVWIPSMGIYKEVSSVSNANDYQARRSNTRYRDAKTGKTAYVHTLNGSGLATSRLIPAIVEQFQNADGSVTVPEVLRPFMGGLEVIRQK